jgi:GNAT superfamily N-acetyltransferase
VRYYSPGFGGLLDSDVESVGAFAGRPADSDVKKLSAAQRIMSISTIELLPVDDPPTRDAARGLITEYLRWIASTAAANYGLAFDVDAMLKSDLDDRTKFYPPDGRFYLVHHSSAYIGVGCLKRLTPTVAEVQRMYIQPQARGLGAGRRLVEQLLVDARAIGYEVVRLESLKNLSVAHALYRSVGFVEITPYTENSMKDYQSAEKMDTYRSSAVFMELRF